MTRPPSVIREALTLLSFRLLLGQIGLALLVFLLSALWLRVPDASALDVAGSLMLAMIVLAVAGGGESWIILRLCARTRTPGRLIRGALLLLIGAILWFGWSMLLDHLRIKDSLRAGYLNSRFPHSLRNLFSYGHILLWLGWMWTALEWVGAGVVGIFVFTATASLQPRRAQASALRSATYWLALIFGTTLAVMLTGSLMQWTPGHGLRVEMLSLLLRLSTVTFVDAAVVCLLLAVLAVCVRRSSSKEEVSGLPHSTPEGMPDTSHPRTAESP
jgi:hypothetical protein